MKKKTELLAEVLDLPREARVEMALRLLASLDAGGEDDVEAAWLAEILKRLDDFEKGVAKTEPWAVVRERIAKRLSVKSDLSRVDAHAIKPEEYAELPELTDEMLKEAKLRKGVKPLSANPRKRGT